MDAEERKQKLLHGKQKVTHLFNSNRYTHIMHYIVSKL